MNKEERSDKKRFRESNEEQQEKSSVSIFYFLSKSHVSWLFSNLSLFLF